MDLHCLPMSHKKDAWLTGGPVGKKIMRHYGKCIINAFFINNKILTTNIIYFASKCNEALEVFLGDTWILAKNLKGYGIFL